MDLDPTKVLFIGLGKSAVGWYRCYLPAMHMGADWVGVAGRPPKMVLQTGLAKGQTAMPDFDEYEVVVIQQPRGTDWLRVIRRMQQNGIKVIYEVDDYLHAIRKMPDHDFSQHFNREALRELELCMRVCDAMIVSTEFLARRYAKFNRNIYVCENGLDLARYALTRPPRPSVNIGWAGATGHERAVRPWLEAVGRVLGQRDRAFLVTIGQQYAEFLRPRFPSRVFSIPFTMIDTYPSAMTMLDIALAPAGPGDFYKGKSDLRWVEAGALGIPTIADPVTYPKIEDRVNGFHAETPEEVEALLLELVDDDDLRTRVGRNAYEYVQAERDMRVAVRQWERVLVEVTSSTSPVAAS